MSKKATEINPFDVKHATIKGFEPTKKRNKIAMKR
jgi:hypothetical protein